jgi:hypothetical protein
MIGSHVLSIANYCYLAAAALQRRFVDEVSRLLVLLRACVLSRVSNRLALVTQIYYGLVNCGSGVWDGVGCRSAKKW